MFLTIVHSDKMEEPIELCLRHGKQVHNSGRPESLETDK